MKENKILLMELLEYGKIIMYPVKQIKIIMKQSIIMLQVFMQKIKPSFYLPMSKTQKTLFSVCSLFLSIYFTFVVYIGNNRLLFTGRIRTIPVFIISVLLFFIVFNLIIFICYMLRNNGIHVGSKKPVRVETIIIFSMLCWLPLLCSLIVRFPGLTYPDNEIQWKQAQTLIFNDWHPVALTLLIWLVTRIVNHYGFVVFVQISVFSIGIGYLIATLESWGYSKKWLLITGLVIAINPFTWAIMIFTFIWKDLTFSILLTYITIMLINIHFSDGAWFNKISNIISFSITVALASMVRHNGIFFTVPLLILALVFYFRQSRRVLIAVLSALLVVFLVKIPLYSALKVEFPHNTYIESVGIPMIIMGDVLVKNPDALSPETKAFLNSIATDEEWRSFYAPGNFNSIKWRFFAVPGFYQFNFDVIETVPVNRFIKMTLHTIKNSRPEAFHAFCDVTAIVWKLTFNRDFSVKTGWFILALLFAGIFALSKKKPTVLLLVIPTLMYDFGTMLLLSGPDTRFFHFNAVITLPIVLVLLSKKETYHNYEYDARRMENTHAPITP